MIFFGLVKFLKAQVKKTSHLFDLLHLFDRAQLLGGGYMDQKPLGIGFDKMILFQSGHPETH